MKEELKLILKFRKDNGKAYFHCVNRVQDDNGSLVWNHIGFVTIDEVKRAYQNLIINSKGDVTNEK